VVTCPVLGCLLFMNIVEITTIISRLLQYYAEIVWCQAYLCHHVLIYSKEPGRPNQPTKVGNEKENQGFFKLVVLASIDH